MKAVVISRSGSPEVLEVRSLPDPDPVPGEVLVRVRTSALNRADLLQRRGRYPAPPGSPPDIPGMEFAGEVERRGERVETPGIGERVMGILGGGGHAELVVVPAGLCMPIPRALSFEEAAAVPEAFLTVHDALFVQAGLGPGEVVLVPAAGSGVGTAAIQLARAAGARVVALSRSEPKRRRLEKFEPAAVLDPTGAELAGRIREVTGGAGADVILDLVGAALWPVYLDVLAPGGRVVVVGTLSGSRVEMNLAPLMRKRAVVRGTVLRSRTVEEKILATRRLARSVLPLLAAGVVRPVVDRVVAMEDVVEAHRVMERNENFGKIVLRIAT